jgi:hypothetical protein
VARLVKRATASEEKIAWTVFIRVGGIEEGKGAKVAARVRANLCPYMWG